MKEKNFPFIEEQSESNHFDVVIVECFLLIERIANSNCAPLYTITTTTMKKILYYNGNRQLNESHVNIFSFHSYLDSFPFFVISVAFCHLSIQFDLVVAIEIFFCIHINMCFFSFWIRSLRFHVIQWIENRAHKQIYILLQYI